MDFITVDHWEEEVWQKWKLIYEEAFGHTHAKPEKIICNMFEKLSCYFHLLVEESEVYAIALSAKLPDTRFLVIDYFAVRFDKRSIGMGRQMLEGIRNWALEDGHFDGILIEVEAKETEENQARIHFWEKCGFIITSYIHDYKVVPEPYRAMYLKLIPNARIPEKAEVFFDYLGKFHRKSFRN